MGHRRTSTALFACLALLVVSIVIIGIRSTRLSAQTKSAPRANAAPPASSFSTFYCDYPFDQYTPFFRLDPTAKVSLYVGTNPKQFRLAIHDPIASSAIAILGGSANVPIPHIPATVDVEAAKIEIQNSGTQAADVCYFYVP